MSIDANMGLRRRKAAGISYLSPLYGDLAFLGQNAVDLYVQDYSKSQHLNTVSVWGIVACVCVCVCMCCVCLCVCICACVHECACQ